MESFGVNQHSGYHFIKPKPQLRPIRIRAETIRDHTWMLIFFHSEPSWAFGLCKKLNAH